MVGTRPLSVGAAAAMMIAIGLFFALTAAAGFIGIAFGDSDSAEPPTQGAVEAGEGSALGWLSEHGVLWMASYAAIAIAAVVCGFGVWLRRRWARRGSQVVMSLCAALFLVAGALLGISLRNSFGDLGSFGRVVFAFGCVAAFGVGLFWASVAALPVWLLARREAREWFGVRP